ncbi:MAG: alpha/beta fold hydrolase [Actinomycetes bacterium]
MPLQRLRQEPRGEQHVVERPDGTALRVVVGGDGPTIVLAHGIGMTLIEWSLIWDLLIERGYRVVAFDQRGHGCSTIGSDGVRTRAMASDYLAVLEAVDAQDAVLVDHSMGGFLALAALLDVPGVAERLRGLVLVATFAGDVFARAPLNRTLAPLLRVGYLQGAAAHSPTLATLFGASFFGDQPSPAMVRVLLDTFLPQDHGPLRPLLDEFVGKAGYDRLSEINLPTVVICGRSDRTTPPHHSRRLADGIPGARMVWVEGKGHMLNWEAPEMLVYAVSLLAPTAVAPASSRP